MAKKIAIEEDLFVLLVKKYVANFPVDENEIQRKMQNKWERVCKLSQAGKN